MIRTHGLPRLSGKNPSMLQRSGSFPALSLALTIIALLVFTYTRALCANITPGVVSSFSSPTAVTNGLIRWWPNLFDAREALSGEEGVVMGVLPSVPSGQPDPTEFGTETGWVLLGPGLTNQVFSASFWAKAGLHPHETAALLEQTSHGRHWRFGLVEYYGGLAMWSGHGGEPDGSLLLALPLGWHHLVIALGKDGRPRYWIDGMQRGAAPPKPLEMAPAHWLSVGNMTKGDTPWGGHLRDLRIYDRALNEVEVREIFASGLPAYPAAKTRARVSATARPHKISWITNLAHVTTRQKIYRHYTTEDGLPGNMVQCLHQTSDGFLWIGTEDGLSRFDGSNFRNYNEQNTPSLRSIGHDISCLAEEKDGTLWGGTFKGLFKIRDGQLEAYTNGLPVQFVQQVLPDRDGWIWVAGAITGRRPRDATILRRYHPDSGTVRGEIVVPGQLRGLTVVSNTVWMATEDPSMILSWDGVAAAPTVAVNIFKRAGIMELSVAQNAPGWIRTRGWAETSGSSNRWVEIQLGSTGPRFCWSARPSHGMPKSSPNCTEGTNDLFLGGTVGLARANDSLLEVFSMGENPTVPEISALCGNRDGGVWFGTEEDGLHFFRDLPVQMLTTRNGLAGNDVRSVAISPEHRVWVATSRGLSFLDEGVWKTSPVTGGKGSVIIAPEGIAWFADSIRSRAAIQMIPDPHKPALTVPFVDWASPTALRFSERGRLWVMCASGISWLNGVATNASDPIPRWNHNHPPSYRMFRLGSDLPRTRLSGLVISKDETAWVGSEEHGLFRFEPELGQVQVITNTLLSGGCTPLRWDNGGALWISTSRGLVYKKGENFQLLGHEQGIPNDSFSDLFEDSDHRFWLPGRRGIHRIERAELEGLIEGKRAQVNALTLGLADGLLTPECSSGSAPVCAQDAQGLLWVPTRNGLAVVDPRKVDASTQPVPVILDRMKVNQQEISIPPSARPNKDRRDAAGDPLLQLPAGSGRRIEFQFAGISLNDAARVRFRYQLEGYDEDWLPTTDIRVAFYTNLKPGDYRFRVQAANSHGLWNSTETVLAFRIRPFFWQSPWFHIGMAVLGIPLILGVHFTRLSAERRRQISLDRQKSMLEKDRLSMDLHDEVGSGLARIAILGEATKGRLPAADKSYHLIDEIVHSARDLASSISDLVWATNPKNETLSELAVHLRGFGARQFEGTGITALLDFPEKCPHKALPSSFLRNVLFVWKEAIANLHKYSGATQVNLGLKVSDTTLSLVVIDNGRGFTPGTVNGGGNGMGNMRRRVEELGGSFQISSSPGTGTRIVVEIPYRRTGDR